jgi:hypothetical protein
VKLAGSLFSSMLHVFMFSKLLKLLQPCDAISRRWRFYDELRMCAYWQKKMLPWSWTFFTILGRARRFSTRNWGLSISERLEQSRSVLCVTYRD